MPTDRTLTPNASGAIVILTSAHQDTFLDPEKWENYKSERLYPQFQLFNVNLRPINTRPFVKAYLTYSFHRSTARSFYGPSTLTFTKLGQSLFKVNRLVPAT